MKKQKSTYRFNFVDVLVILLLIGVVGGVYYFISGKNSTNSGFGSADKKKVEYVIEVKTLDKEYVDNISVGDKMYETVKHGFIGTVKSVEISPAWTITTNDVTGETGIAYYPVINPREEDLVPEESESTEAVEDTEAVEGDGEAVVPDDDYVPMYDYYNAKITVEAELDFAGNIYSVGSYEIGIGRLINFRVPHYVGSAYCVSLKTVE